MRIFDKTTLGEGKWLALHELKYEDNKGVIRSWECASRKKCSGAVLIIATLVPSGKLILIRQFRPPTGKIVLEFPAGLMDGDEAPEVTALRELREETGYIGTVQSVIPQGYSSPGMTGETVYIAKMTVVESDQKELKTEFDDAEDIETILVSPEDLPELIRKEYAAGNGVDIKVSAYTAAIS